MRKFSVGAFIIALLLPLLIGVISAFLSAEGMSSYGTMEKPPLSPPAWIFPVAWTILYLMMGLASYFVYMSNATAKGKSITLLLYLLQLGMNFMWSIIFFNWRYYLSAFIWLIIMWCLVILCAFRFFRFSKAATLLLIPYILWLTFAAYLNLGSYLIQRG